MRFDTVVAAGLERLSEHVRTLDLQLQKYDNEVLFAIRQLFPDASQLQFASVEGPYQRYVVSSSFHRYASNASDRTWW